MKEEYEYLRRQIEASEKLAKERPFGCKCPTMAIKLLGDGCSECNPELHKDLCREEEEDMYHG